MIKQFKPEVNVIKKELLLRLPKNVPPLYCWSSIPFWDALKYSLFEKSINTILTTFQTYP